MTYIKDMVQKYIDLLKAQTGLEEPSDIKKYHFGAPKKTPTRYPVIYVQLDERTYSGESDINRYLYDHRFEIGVMDRVVREDDAEKSVYDKIELIDTVLDANPTLDGLAVDQSLPRDYTVVHATEGNYALAFARITDVKRKWLP